MTKITQSYMACAICGSSDVKYHLTAYTGPIIDGYIETDRKHLIDMEFCEAHKPMGDFRLWVLCGDNYFNFEAQLPEYIYNARTKRIARPKPVPPDTRYDVR